MSTSLLLVDDDRTFSSLAASVLSQEGFRVQGGPLAPRDARGPRSRGA